MDYSFIEELSMNHWQSLSALHYDGWVLRFADGYTKRANSISPTYDSTLDLHYKMIECESLYAANHLPTTYKITPFVQPAHLDRALEERGYSRIDTTSVKILNLEQLSEPKLTSVIIHAQVTAEWLDHFCRLNGVKEQFRGVMERMLSNIRTKKGFTFYYEGQVVACGFGEQMILNLLKWGIEHGAKHSYLLVVSNNTPALRLYSKLGFSVIYQYWYRVRSFA